MSSKCKMKVFCQKDCATSPTNPMRVSFEEISWKNIYYYIIFSAFIALFYVFCIVLLNCSPLLRAICRSRSGEINFNSCFFLFQKECYETLKHFLGLPKKMHDTDNGDLVLTSQICL